ncbi:ead/Ea22-like family protein [Salmonella enterica]|nr:ead/Ea22-like family protein [Salmonella enterica]EHK5999342.1 ead/Ea22-like family protein [Salmonella enterica]EIF5124561.1 ead/Ea22-like family protein [Salmonella enterica]EIF5348737.1 ead/Ea22-like family protein [Salmonella enterica]EIF5657334.1 ead/Ea22-like family protein [Salmonella enterica]
MTNITELTAKLKAAAQKVTPGRMGDRIDGSGSIKYQCVGYDGSLVLQVDHKNMEYGFIGDNADADEEFFRACVPDAILAMIEALEAAEKRVADLAAENAALKKAIPPLRMINVDNNSWDDVSIAEDIGFNQAISAILRNLPQIPATDRFLADQRALGVEMFAAHCQKRHGEMMKTEPNEHARNQAITATRRAGEFALYFAAQLRAEVLA